MRYAALLSLLPVALAAQSAAPPVPDTKPEDLASLDGQVLDAAAGGPVRKAAVILRLANATGPAGINGFSTSTDDSGKFAMKGIEPGRYRLTVSRSGYVNGEYGSRGPGRQGATISLGRAQNLTGLVVKLTPHGVVTGRILDRDGDPLQSAIVQLFGYSYLDGRRRLLPAAGNGATNDLGEFRIFGVAPGKYFVRAQYLENPVLIQTSDRSAAPLSSENYVPVFYPGTFDLSSAIPLNVPAGGEVRADLILDKTRTVRIKGRVTNAVGDATDYQTVILTQRGSPAGPLSNNFGRVIGGRFEIHAVVPGSYDLTAVQNHGDDIFSTRIPIDVGESNIDDLVLTIGTGFEMRAHVRIEGESTMPLTSLRAMLETRDPEAMIGGLPNAPVQADGTLRLAPVNPGSYNLTFPGLADGFYVKSIRSGETDLLTQGFDVIDSAPADVQVVLSPNAAQIAGIVQNPETGQPVAATTVVLVPQEMGRSYRTATTDQSGGFALTSVVPGEYKLYAWEDVENGAYFDPEFLKSVESKGEKVSLRERDQVTLTLNVIPASQ